MTFDSTVLRTAALVLGFASAWACGVPDPLGDCPPGADGCECAFGFCEEGLACVADVCMPADATTETTDVTTTTLSSTTVDASSSEGESSSSDSGADESSSSSDTTSGAPPIDPVFEATIMDVPISFDIDPHAYLSPAGTLLVVGSSSSMQGDLLLRIPPTSIGMHACVLDQTDVAIYWTIPGPMGALELSTRTSGDCTITVDESGEVGEVVSGTFEGQLLYPGDPSFPPVAVTDGVFQVTRTPDE
jgi:hypothetical protein